MPFNRPVHGGNLVWAAQLARCSPAAILDFSASINPLGPPASAIAAISRNLKDLTSYPDPSYVQLRNALSQFHQIPPDWILPGNGAAELLTWACRELASGKETILLTPAFSDYRRALKAFDAEVLEVPLFPLSSSPSSLPSLSSLSPASGLLLNNPHNPTGVLFSRESILPYLDQFGLVVVDEAFMDFVVPSEQPSLIDEVRSHPNLVIIRSLTKFFSLPGLRLGYAIAHPDRLQRWQQWRDPWSVNSLAAAVGEVVLQDGEFQQQTLDWLTAARPQLFEQLVALPGLHPLPGAANFLLVQSEVSCLDLQLELLKRHHILIRDCISFPELGDRFFRVAVRTPAENLQLCRGLAEILADKG